MNWGNVTSVKNASGVAITDPNHAGNLNPFRYRGYYMDTEIGLYYLVTRYYDPVTYRFINADGYFQTGAGGFLDKNMGAYCHNNPIMFVDSNGKYAISIGASVNATFIWGLCYGETYVMDSEGNIGKQRTYAGTSLENLYVGVLDIGIGGNVSILWDKDATIYDFEKDAAVMGASGGFLGYFGGDALFLPEYSMAPSGVAITVGVGIGADIHLYQPKTETIWSYNAGPLVAAAVKNIVKKAAVPKTKSCSGCGKPIGIGPGYCGGW